MQSLKVLFPTLFLKPFSRFHYLKNHSSVKTYVWKPKTGCHSAQRIKSLQVSIVSRNRAAKLNGSNQTDSWCAPTLLMEVAFITTTRRHLLKSARKVIADVEGNDPIRPQMFIYRTIAEYASNLHERVHRQLGEQQMSVSWNKAQTWQTASLNVVTLLVNDFKMSNCKWFKMTIVEQSLRRLRLCTQKVFLPHALKSAARLT